jgi:type II secretory pathway pseudopilin PulG
VGRRLRRRVAALAREDSGWTLIELLVAAVIGLALIGSATFVFAASIQSQPRTASRGADIEQARLAMERLTRELRQAWDVPTATSSQISVLTYVQKATCGGASATTALPCRVTYTCTTTACSRVEANPDGTGPGPAAQVVSGITGPAVFSYSPDTTTPTFIGVNMVFPSDHGDDAITLSDGIAMRLPGPP